MGHGGVGGSRGVGGSPGQVPYPTPQMHEVQLLVRRRSVRVWAESQSGVPAAVCRWGLCPRCPGWGKVSVGGTHIIILCTVRICNLRGRSPKGVRGEPPGYTSFYAVHKSRVTALRLFRVHPYLGLKA
jgi:hypothetical protein